VCFGCAWAGQRVGERHECGRGRRSFHSIPSPHSSPSFIHLITTAAEEKKKRIQM